jgi:hypothetical protein
MKEGDLVAEAMEELFLLPASVHIPMIGYAIGMHVRLTAARLAFALAFFANCATKAVLRATRSIFIGGIPVQFPAA